ncbi:hypothetical protein [Dickeya chrysanthemi]|nr:hypothetical protein [Dickeya chrysanthemi]
MVDGSYRGAPVPTHGKVSGRESASDITVFDSFGLAIQDLYIAKAVINA